MRHISLHNKVCSSKEIANTYHIPQEIMAKTMQKLCKKSYIGAVKGPYGGYFLTTNLEKINLIDFIEDIEGPIGIVKCLSNSDCGVLEFCNIKSPINKINNNIRTILNKVNLHEITS